MSVLEVRGLRVDRRSDATPVVLPFDLDLAEGQILGLVGESGSGKTTAGLALFGYVRRGLVISGGTVRVRGVEILDLPPAELRRARADTIAYVAQDPGAALNPALTIGRQLTEALPKQGDAADLIAQTMRDVRLPDDRAFLRRYPHELSGGQQQRVLLAMAFARRPAVIVLDEPTTGLDVTTQAHVLDTVRELAGTYGCAALYITHDLSVVASLADRIAVMYAGSMVEEGDTGAVFAQPAHPYTDLLTAAIPLLQGPTTLVGIPGRAPSPGERPPGCPFAPRCPLAEAACEKDLPALATVGPDHRSGCLRAADVRRTPRLDGDRIPVSASASIPTLELRGVTAKYGDTEVLHGVDLAVHPGECLAIVGESGSGKTTLARTVAGLHRDRGGDVLLDGQILAASARERPMEQRRRVQYVFQNPYASLNPRRTAGESIRRALVLAGVAREDHEARINEMMVRVSLTPAYAHRFPNQLSGGERQRVAIARALVAGPDLVICDEITSALDVSVQAAIVDLLEELRRELGLTLLFVTHNLPLVRSIADRVAVLREGTVVEVGPAEQVVAAPQHPYTRQLLADSPAPAYT